MVSDAFNMDNRRGVQMKEKVVAIIQDVEDGTKILFRHEDDIIKLAQKMYNENEEGSDVVRLPCTLLEAKLYIHYYCEKWNVYFKSQEAFDILLRKVNCAYGAPMGRGSRGVNQPDYCKVFDRKVPMSQGYDKGGAYWGLPHDLRVAYSEDLQYVYWYRTGGNYLKHGST